MYEDQGRGEEEVSPKPRATLSHDDAGCQNRLGIRQEVERAIRSYEVAEGGKAGHRGYSIRHDHKDGSPGVSIVAAIAGTGDGAVAVAGAGAGAVAVAGAGAGA